MTISWGRSRVSSSPFKADGPAARFQQAAHGLQHGALAGAVGPDEGDDLTLLHGDGDVLEGVDLTVVGVHIFHFEQGHGAKLLLRGRLAVAVCVRRSSLAEIGFDHLRVALDLLRRALGDLLAVVEHGHGFGDPHHHPHLVLDQQDGDPELHPAGGG